ncbi:MAG: family 10 glycosylhydrolase [Candidatus Latescibacterota bacterium]|jgi:hypothetical protein
MHGEHRLILCNDGGPLLGPNVEAPIGADGLERLVLDPLAGTQIDTLFWQLGTDPYLSTPTHRLSDWHSHRTQVAPVWGDGIEKFTSAGNWRIYENTRHLFEQGTDPIEVIVEGGHRRGLDVFASMRVNDIHDGFHPDDDPPFLSPTKRAHPDWLLGRTPNPLPRGLFTGLSRFAFNFALPEVREYRLAIAREVIDNYEVDGLEWDFCRCPRLFPEGTSRDNAHVMTDVIKSLREALDKKGAQVGRHLKLAVRVPPTIELAAAFGIDVETWIADGLIDILIAGVVLGSMHRVPVESFVEAARDTDVKVIAQNLGMFWDGRPNSTRVLWGEPDVYSDDMCRASAATYWQAGVDGLYLWNNQIIEFARDASYDGQPWREIGAPESLHRMNKHYVVDSPADREMSIYEFGAPPIPEGPLPQSLDVPGDTAEVSVDIADDIAESADSPPPAHATLRLLIVNLTNRDEITVALNDVPLDMSSARIALNYNDCWLDFEVSDGLLKRGWNHLLLQVLSRNPRVSAPLTVASVEAIIEYTTSE